MSLLSDPLKAFLEVYKAGTVLAAATKLGLTQTGVTQRLRSLEKNLGITLFLRSRRGMRPTTEGEELFRYCQSVLRLESEELTFLKEEHREKNVKISFSGPTSFLRTRALPVLNKLLSQYPGLVLNVDFDDFEDRIQKLRSGEVDFAFIRAQDVPNELEGKALAPNRFFLVAPSKWKGRVLREIVQNERIISFDPTDDMAQRYLTKFKLTNIARLDRHSVNDLETQIELIEKGHGYGVLEENFLPKRKLIVLNNGEKIENRMALCWMKRPVYSKLFLEITKSF